MKGIYIGYLLVIIILNVLNVFTLKDKTNSLDFLKSSDKIPEIIDT